MRKIRYYSIIKAMLHIEIKRGFHLGKCKFVLYDMKDRMVEYMLSP